jgi:thiamine pyrophosphokinase
MRDQVQLQSDRFVLVGPVMKEKLRTSRLDDLGLGSVPQIAVDGGDRFASKPELVVGDGDSSIAIHAKVLWIKKTSVDETDFGFCLRYLCGHAQASQWKELHLFGFLGSRRDHEWAMIGEVLQALRARPHPSVVTVYNEKQELEFTIHSSGKHHFNHRGLFSILSLESSRMTFDGNCTYCLKEQELQPLSGRGVSNEAQGSFTVSSSGVFMMIPQKANP